MQRKYLLYSFHEVSLNFPQSPTRDIGEEKRSGAVSQTASGLFFMSWKPTFVKGSTVKYKYEIGVLVVTALAILGLSSCGKQVDLTTSGAQPVPGVSNLWRFCDGPVAIYFSNWDGGSDEYEFLVYDHPMCVGEGPAQPRIENLPDGEN